MISTTETKLQRVFFISDVHLGIKNSSIKWVEHITEYFDKFLMPELIESAKTKNTALVIAGDFFDNRQTIDINVLNAGQDIIERIASVVPVYMIVGNHDIYKKRDNAVTSLRTFRTFKNVIVYDSPHILIMDGGHKMLLLPWFDDAAKQTDFVNSYKNDVEVMVMHSDIAGFKYDNGRDIVKGVDISSLGKTLVLSGHIHKRQEANNAVYFGSPYQMTRSDIGNEKGLYWISINDNDANKITLHYKTNDYSPKFLRIPIENILSMKMEDIGKIVKHNYVDIVIKSGMRSSVNTSKLIAAINEYEPHKLEILLDRSDAIVVQEADIHYDNTGNVSVGAMFENAVNKMDLPAETKAELIRMSDEYLTLGYEFLSGAKKI